jgi:hypothetical protein
MYQLLRRFVHKEEEEEEGGREEKRDEAKYEIPSS